MGTQSAQRSQAMYREEEKLCLKWNDFQENAISAFGTLREDREFADVTLACEDGQQVEAHKVILASSSPFFLNILKRNKHPHPLIYMRGLKSEELVSLVDFIYFGEANVHHENLDSFLAVAEELQLKGLMGLGAETNKSTSILPPPKSKTQIKEQLKTLLIQEDFPQDTFDHVDNIEPEPVSEEIADVTDYTVAADLQDLDEKIKSMMKVSENVIGGSSGNQRKRICKVCGKEDRMSNIKLHIEHHHITGVSHPCHDCGKTLKTRGTLRLHVCK